MTNLGDRKTFMDIRKFLKPEGLLRPFLEVVLFFRGLMFIGTKIHCPCCGWSFRYFIKSGNSLKRRDCGYCPRCNSKARHRRNFLYLKRRTNLFQDDLRLLHVAPKYSLSRVFSKLKKLDYIAIGLQNDLNITALMDLSKTSFSSNVVDCIVCIHVLEHIETDRLAIGELYRVLKPGGWAVVSVPIRLDQITYEDPTITSRADRKREFNEKDHVRIYGYDFEDRLKDAGFEVEKNLGTSLDPNDMRKYGLMDDETIFHLTKP